MTIDENDFFRQITVRICGSLDIEQAMFRCFQYLRRFLPGDSMFLNLYDPGLGALRTIARVTVSESNMTDQLIPLSQEARSSLEGENVLDLVKIVNRPELDVVFRDVMRFFSHPEWSFLVMRMVIEGKRIGGFTLAARGKDRYSHEHARLFSLLNEPFAIAISNSLKHQEILLMKDSAMDDNRYLRQELLRQSGDEIIGRDLGLKDVMEMVREVAPLNTAVLLLGDTGVGKELVANAIHRLSSRKHGPLIKVNCGAIPENLMDSELFGHEKGAFTGAVAQKRGRFERASHGTIFLDEIGELPLHAQVRMLRVLQDKEIERVGGSEPISVDIRVIAATHRDVEKMVKSNQFREDLWFRLNVFPIMIPPLRKRREDIPALVHHLIERKSRDLKLNTPSKLATGAIDRLMAYNWPGNVRELENVVERALILNKQGPLRFDQLVLAQQEDQMPGASVYENEMLKLDEVVYKHIQGVLKIARGKVRGPGGAAELLGINPSTLRNRMKKLGIPYGRRASP